MPPRVRETPSWAGLAFALALAVTAYALFAPDPSGGRSGPPGTDKIVHAVMFGVLTATALLRFGQRALVLVLLLAYAAVSELVQAVWLPGRAGDVRDLLADVAGVLAAWWLGRRWA